MSSTARVEGTEDDVFASYIITGDQQAVDGWIEVIWKAFPPAIYLTGVTYRGKTEGGRLEVRVTRSAYPRN